MKIEMINYELGKRPALLVVDVTRSLADSNVKSAYKPCIEAGEYIQKLLKVSRESNIPIIFTRGGKLSHTSGGINLTKIQRGGWAKKTKVRVEDQEMAKVYMEILPALGPKEGEIVLDKSRSSAFFKTMLDTYLSSMKIDTLIITGMMTSGCIRATVTDAFSNDFDILIPKECVADKRIEAHNYHMDEMNLKYGQVKTLEEVVGYIESIS
tara:strand:- start:417 stop:1046 length:630 start_codon:yes stop_codon:yes gene_type:complete